MDNMFGAYSFQNAPLACQNTLDWISQSPFLAKEVDPGCIHSAEPFCFLSDKTSISDGQFVKLDIGVWFYFSGYFKWSKESETVDYSSSLEAVSRVALQIYNALVKQDFQELRQLNGSFYILVYDTSEKCLYSITDRLRSRNVFYRTDGPSFFISDDIRFLLAGRSQKLDMRSVVEFLRFTMIFQDRTLYEEISCQPASSIMCISKAGAQKHAYWSLRYDETWQESDSEYIESIAASFKGAVDRSLNGHSGVGLMLSGGLDSRMIAAALTNNQEIIKAVSFGGFHNPEVTLAKKVANKCGFPFGFINREPDYYANIFSETSRISNGLYNFYHAHMLGVHEQIRQQGLHTLIHGWGLDVPFSASYIPKKRVKLLLGRGFQLVWPENLKSGKKISDIYLNSLSVPEDQLTRDLLAGEYANLWLEWPREVVGQKYEQAKSNASDPYNQLDYMMLCDFTKFRSYIYPLSVRAIARERCPLFDNQVIDVSLKLPPRLRFCSRAYGKAIHLLNPGISKLPYNRIGVSVLQPELFKTIGYFMQPVIGSLRAAKRQFLKEHMEYPTELNDSYPNMGALLRTPAMEKFVKEVALNGPIFDLEIIKREKMVEVVEAHMRGTTNYSEIITAIMTLNQWLLEN